MIDKLRKKLVAINLVSVGVVFFIAVVLIFAIGYSSIGEERHKRMYAALGYDTADDTFGTDQLYRDMALCEYDRQTGKLTWYVGSNFSYDVSELDSIAEKIIERRSEAGFTKLRLRYVADLKSDKTHVRIVFNDLDSSENSLAPFLIFALVTLLLGLGIYFWISIMLASMALKPVEESWAKQKQFVADASHELKTPLSVIMANTEIIASHGSDTVDSQMRWIDNTRQESERMAELIASLLFLAKNDDGLKVSMSNVDLSDCLAATVLSQDAVFFENGKKFNYSLAHNITVYGNEAQLKQLFTILLDNADKYSTDEGNISLDMSTNGRHVVVTVANDSEPLTDDQLSHLFDRFYTVDESRNSRGNGLGLSIAKTIVDTHGGSINVAYADGRTTFTVMLPVVKNK
uniref:sensor histidine kinase n=1 Tax=Candidatus Fimenecus sp. TaxID=3022888 RepID=UPI004028FF4A